MIDVAEILPNGSFNGATDKVVLDHDHRLRRRIVLDTVGGLKVRLNENMPVQLRDGDGLKLTNGEVILVEAQPESLMEITAPNLGALVRIAWHLGNRHLPTQLLGEKIRIRHDHVIGDMAAGLGGTVTHLHGAFDPEGGAYDTGAAPAAHAHGHHPHDHHHHD